MPSPSVSMKSTWLNIKRRCLDERNHNYQRYGGRGIKVYERWVNNFAAFRDYIETTLGPRPLGHTLDRILNDGHYEPGNLRWASKKEQSRNMRTNRLLTYKGVTKSVAAWAEMLEISAAALYVRLYKGISAERAIEMEGHPKKHCVRGHDYAVTRARKRSGKVYCIECERQRDRKSVGCKTQN